MKKIVSLVVLALVVCAPAFAGGIKANTNQSPQWVRHLARGTSLDPDAVYYNPAGAAFFTDGFHFSVGNQFVFQRRRATIDYAPFAMNGGNPTKQYDGKTFAPLLPNLDFVWKHNRLALMFSLGVGGGGGSAKYDDGLGTFESNVAALPLGLSQLGVPTSGYSLNMNLKGKSITYAVNVGAAFRITDWLSVAAELRINYVGNSYEGYLKDIMINPTLPALGLDGSMVPAYPLFQKVGSMPLEMIPEALRPAVGAAKSMVGSVADKELKSEQSGWGFSPVVALYFKKGSWSAMAKYEFRTAIDLENETTTDQFGLFPDGAKSGYDQPSLMALAVTKRFRDKVSVTAEYHYYWDKHANMGTGIGSTVALKDLVRRNTMEYIAGVEWDVCKRLLLSAGVQYTDYKLAEGFQTELGYQLDCVSVGLGGAFKISDKVKFNLAAARSFFLPKTIVTGANTPLQNTSKYSRGSTIVSFGFDFSLPEGRKHSRR